MTISLRPASRSSSSAVTGGTEAPAAPDPRVAAHRPRTPAPRGDSFERAHHSQPQRNPSGLTQADQRGNSVIDGALANGALMEGTNAPAVHWMKRMLSIAGFDAGTQDTNFDAKTTDALKQFQGSVGLPASGQLDQATFQQLEGVEKRVRAHHGQWAGVGQKSDAIKKEERQLASLGYDVGQADGVFDKKTADAARAFRHDEHLGHGGVFTPRLERELRTELRDAAHDPYHSRVKPSRAHSHLDQTTARAAARSNADGTTGLGLGDHGQDVANVQSHLRAAGYDPQHTNGRFDQRTRGMVEQFQRHSKLPVNGRVDAKTWAALKKSYLYAQNGTSPPESLGERSSAVAHTQRALQEAGYKRVQVNGIFDQRTENAVKRFERQHHRHVDGNVGKGDLAAIEKAGVHGSDAAFRNARSVLGRNISDLKYHGPLARYLDKWPGNDVCCANFVSACLEKAGQISPGEHNDGVGNLSANLAADRRWSRTSLSHAKPGDVVCFTVPGEGHNAHVEMFAGWSGGAPLFIGSNNVNPDGSQRIAEGQVGYAIDAIYHFHG